MRKRLWGRSTGAVLGSSIATEFESGLRIRIHSCVRPHWQRNTTLALIALLLVSFGVRYYLDTREHFRNVEEPVSFAVSNGIAQFRSFRGTFTRTNSDLVQLLTHSGTNFAVATLRERMRGDKVVGWRAVEFAVPTTRDRAQSQPLRLTNTSQSSSSPL
jgi:hypothetical protein